MGMYPHLARRMIAKEECDLCILLTRLKNNKC